MRAVWAFVLAVAAADVLYAHRWLAVLDGWELNPFAVWCGSSFGIAGIVVLKGCGLGSSYWAIRALEARKPTVATKLMVFVVLVHVVLLACLAAAVLSLA